MHVKRYTKSLDFNFRLCSFAANEFHNNGAKRTSSQIAEDSSELHYLREQVGNGIIDLETAVEEASCEDVSTGLRNAIARDPYWHFTNLRYEAWFALGPRGSLIKGKNKDKQRKELAVGKIDRIGPIPITAVKSADVSPLLHDPSKKVLLIEDMKYGWATDKDDESERHTYVLGGMTLFPGFDIAIFSYYYPRFGQGLSVEWVYELRDKTQFFIIPPKGYGEPVELTGRKQNPLLEFVQERVEVMQATEPTPTPGEHCNNWAGSGEPCQFNGNNCPLAEHVPAVIEGTSQPAITKQDILNAPKDKAPGLAFLARKYGYISNDDVDEEIGSLILLGSFQLTAAGNGEIKDLQKIAKEKNLVFTIGETKYGYFQSEEKTIDVVFFLDWLLSMEGVTTADIAKGINVSESSLKKLSKRKLGDTKQRILDVCVDRKLGTPKWGSSKIAVGKGDADAIPPADA
jgi:hypothetical protein